MAKDPVCGMFVEEKPDTIRHMIEGKEYFFCSTQCLNEFTAPEKELKKLKTITAVSVAHFKSFLADSLKLFSIACISYSPFFLYYGSCHQPHIRDHFAIPF